MKRGAVAIGVVSIIFLLALSSHNAEAGSGQVKVTYNGHWYGSIETVDEYGTTIAYREVEGSGDKTFYAEGAGIRATFTKIDTLTNSWTLKVEILVNGAVAASDSTNSPYTQIYVQYYFQDSSSSPYDTGMESAVALSCIGIGIILFLLFIIMIIMLVKRKKRKTSTQESGKPCPNCRQSMRYIAEHQLWWCDNCKKYESEMGGTPQVVASAEQYQFDDVKAKMDKLRALKEEDLLTDEEYEEKRRKILDGI